MAKIALLIGVSEYEPGLDGLPSAVNDVTAMQQVLTNPEIGEFAADAVTVLQNPSRQAMEDAIYTLFANRAKDDLVLLYFSGHGVVDDGGEFYFASRFSRKEQGRLVPTTAVAARSVRDWLEQSRSQYKVIILDSCFSGAFAKGVKAKDSGSVNPEQFLGGKGTAILTASNSTQYALAQEGFDLSVYTHYLVEGIRTGGADQDDDGFIAMEELHAYASSKVKEAAPAMTPEFYPVKEGYKILLAKSPKDDPALKYRKQVRLLAEEDEGDFSFINRSYLDDLQRGLTLLPDDATTIETEELEPYRQRRAKVDRYRTVFEGAIAKRYPLTDRDRLGLQRIQQLLSLRDEDVSAIEAPFLAPKQAEYERQQAELVRQGQEKRQQEQATRQKLEQEQQKQKALERQQELAAQSQRLLPVVNPPPNRKLGPGVPLQPFEFETAKLVIAKKQGLFGGKTTVEINRSRGRAEYFAEDLGNGVTLDMIAIPGGTFQMGADEYGREKPIHAVTIEPFFMGKYSVTQAQYEAIVGSNPSNFKGAQRPVEQVSWEEAIAFCTQLSQKTGKSYRLPSEAEWEYACRAGTTTPFHFGETITPELANYDGNYIYGDAPKGTYRKRTTDVGSFSANTFGLYDVHGNVWEWCADHWHQNYQGAPTDESAWTTNGDSEQRVIRGGSWNCSPVSCRSANRNYIAPANRFNNVGFRVVCSVFPGLS